MQPIKNEYLKLIKFNLRIMRKDLTEFIIPNDKKSTRKCGPGRGERGEMGRMGSETEKLMARMVRVQMA